MTTGDDGQALFDWSSLHSAIIVDNDTECATDEVSHQQVRTVTSKLKETTIKRHKVLGTSQTRMTCITLDSNNYILHESVTVTANKSQLECGPMPNVMAALPTTGGALCSTPQFG